MNLYIGFLGIIIFTLLGKLFSGKNEDKRAFFIDFINFNLKLKNEILFTHKTIDEISLSLNNGDFKNALQKYLDSGEVVKLKYLDKNEFSLFENYLFNLGNADIKTQMNFLNSIEKELGEYHQKAIQDEKKYRSLYLKVGFLVGLIFFILVI